MTETFDSSDPKIVKAAIKQGSDKEKIAREGLRTMMSTEPGRVWLYRALMFADPFRNAFSPDSNSMAFRCGEINVGLQLIDDLTAASPDLYLQMIKENK